MDVPAVFNVFTRKIAGYKKLKQTFDEGYYITYRNIC